jgi:hypothetical protein
MKAFLSFLVFCKIFNFGCACVEEEVVEGGACVEIKKKRKNEKHYYNGQVSSSKTHARNPKNVYSLSLPASWWLRG